MSKEIKVSQAAVEANVTAISGTNQYFTGVALTPTDNRTTIVANTKGQAAYAKSQAILESFGDAMEQEIANIRSLGIAFQEKDKLVWEIQEGITNIFK
ncbi:TIGR04197 family type VII secretion effector [Roseburia sp. 499]|uniref:TIGR04197 family type VII secretion effector n=1 Tax=Roseburia sp. 499 TaxID=1261634 RepID=UPI0009514A57|nr:TIGR04197 family type VII secretion effector [Roseburia sp. 499]WVK70306.1 TIGR04197 family type VII secretion effector [Roseburia sp. 499]